MKTYFRILIPLIFLFSVLCLSGCGKADTYSQALTAFENGEYELSAQLFESLGEYKDSSSRADSAGQLALKQADYERACALADSASYEEAAELFDALGTYLDSADRASDAKYRAADLLAQAGQWEQAAKAFEALGSYLDSAERAAEANYTYAVELYESGDYENAEVFFMKAPEHGSTELYLTAIRLSGCQVGDTVCFGSYMQADGADSTSPISWRVLRKEDDRLLLLSEQGLDCMRFHEYCYPFWADSELREWLNSTFLSSAFTEAEQLLISPASNTTAGYLSELGLYLGGPDTEDTVFLLSKEDLAEYFPEKAERICLPTPYALAAGAQCDDSGFCSWWTRSPGDHHGQISIVASDGSLNPYARVSWTNVCIRPAIWVSFCLPKNT